MPHVIGRALCALAILAMGSSVARATFLLGSATNYGLLYEGNGAKTLSYNNSTLTGNIGIGGAGKFQGNGPGTITGLIQFSAANTGQYSNSGLTLNPAAGNPQFSIASVTSALNTTTMLSQTLGLETGTSVVINNAGTPINAGSGTLDGSGNRVFNVTGVNFPNGTQTINGAATDYVVFNIPFAASLNGSIALSGGITPDDVLFNFTPSTANLTNYNNAYANLTGGPTMTISTNGLTTTGVFLDPTGDFSVNHTNINGRIIGGDTHNSAFVSGAALTAPPSDPVPEPGSLVLAALGFVGLFAWRQCRGGR